MQPHSRRWLILIALCLSTLVLVIDNMALTVAVPALVADLGTTAQDIQWIRSRPSRATRAVEGPPGPVRRIVLRRHSCLLRAPASGGPRSAHSRGPDP
ncbi:unnamed protein product [[Actinomadura] parvosata subsp. kistnae]|uniref:hypothetical protein n=1 Tax=[Actinomadura] parvosata TaxID=1955412 RepID=UPI0009ADF4D5|nr:hypothetical protein [Nonomuraea sp. ATCC 55076]SPL98627.1 unnamed protein product [Actinomadura parvosata subsp. kistnae]